jgi:hypothetical protein
MDQRKRVLADTKSSFTQSLQTKLGHVQDMDQRKRVGGYQISFALSLQTKLGYVQDMDQRTRVGGYQNSFALSLQTKLLHVWDGYKTPLADYNKHTYDGTQETTPKFPQGRYFT